MSIESDFMLTIEEDIGVGELGFCMCGDITSAMRYVRDSLQLIDDLNEKVYTDQILYENWRQKTDNHYPSDGAMYFMYYWLDDKEYTEHGGCVPGWLTQKGKNLLQTLNQYIQTDEQQTESKANTSPEAGK